MLLEIRLETGPESADDLDAWLQGVADDLPGAAGVIRTRAWRRDDDADRVSRVLHVSFESEAFLERFLDTEATALRMEIRERFGERCSATFDVLRLSNASDEAPGPPPRCLNCDAVLAGQYCTECGQRGQNRLISIVELVRNAFGDLFELDSRLWRTLIPLAIRPGRLTDDYLQGRRARYMPPFRMYLVLSLAFFLIAFFDPYEELGILFEPGETAVTATTPMEPSPPDERDATIDGETGSGEAGDSSPGLRISINGDQGEDEDGDEGFNDCSFEEYDPAELPAWLARRLARERLQRACENITSEEGEGWQGVADRLIENVPAGLFILLPMMALVLMILHPLSRRYYVEHLLFVIHYHSFVFLALTAEILFSRFLGFTGLPDALGDIAGMAATVYIPVYLYKAMRRVYRQRHLATLFKFGLLVVAYFIGLLVIVAVAGILAAFSA